MMEKIKTVIGVIFSVIFFTYALLMTVLLLNFNEYGVTQFGSTSIILINQDVSSKEYKKGELVIVESKHIDNLKKGQEIFTYRVDSKGRANIEIGSIGEIYSSDDAVAFENGDTYSMEYVIGVGTKKYATLGTILGIIESKWGFLFTVLLPCFIFFVYQLGALIAEIKYGERD